MNMTAAALQKLAADNPELYKPIYDEFLATPNFLKPADFPSGKTSQIEKLTKSDTGPYRSKLEAAFAQELDLWVATGKIASWRFEALTFSIGGQGRDACRYSPDFVTFSAPSECGHVTISLYEVKGPNKSQRDDAKVKFRTAPQVWPCFVWYVAVGTRDGRAGMVTWAIRRIECRAGG